MGEKVTRRDFLKVAGAAAGAAVLAGCGGNTQVAAPTTGAVAPTSAAVSAPTVISKKIRVGFIVAAQFNSWIIQMQREADSYASKHASEMEYIKTNADGDITKQVYQIGDMLVKGVDVLVTMPLSPTALVEPIKRALKEVPVVTFAWDINTPTTVHLKHDESRYGQIGATWLDTQLNHKGQIVILRGSAGTSSDTDRYNAVRKALNPAIVILDEVYTDWDYAKGKTSMTTLLAAHPVIDGVWSSGAATSQGAVEAMQAAHRPLVPITAENNNGFLKMWKNLNLTSAGVIEPCYTSQLALDAALKVVRGQKMDPVIPVDMPLITQETLDKIVRMDCSDDFWPPSMMTEDEIRKLYVS